MSLTIIAKGQGWELARNKDAFALFLDDDFLPGSVGAAANAVREEMGKWMHKASCDNLAKMEAKVKKPAPKKSYGTRKAPCKPSKKGGRK